MGKTGHFLLLIFIIWPGITTETSGQQSALTNRFMSRPLILNPAFAGTRNSVAIDVYSRQQWIGIEDAPSFYSASIHFPVNESMASIGTGAWSEQTGPFMYNRLFFDYAYLIRVSRRAFLSLGLRVGADHFNFNLQKLQLIDYNDPEFETSIDNEFRPSWGAGFMFYTPAIFMGVSLPHRPVGDLSWSSEAAANFESAREIDLSGGININISKEATITLGAIHRIVQNDIPTTDMGLIISLENGIRGGVNYRPDYSAAALFGIKITREIDFLYSYEFPTDPEQPIVKKGAHELTVSFNFTRWIKYNRNRIFLKKKVEKEELNSIRYF